MPTTHVIPLERRTLHGHFSRDLAPILTIAPGDTVQFSTLEAGWGLECRPAGPYSLPRRMFEGRVAGLDDGHALIGPIAIEGAKPGMTLEVHIKTVRPGRWGYVGLGGGWPEAITARLGISGERAAYPWALDPDSMIGRDAQGRTVALSPFLGVMGMPPAAPGVHDTAPPRVTGGNMDCKELVEGTRLFLPIQVEGGLFSAGDGHAVQGDGEVNGTAIECPMEQVELTLDLHDDFPLTTAVAQTPAGWLTMGFDPDLNEATLIALEAMVTLMQRLYGLSRLDAAALSSLAVDMHVTQIVNGTCGVHALLAPGRVQMWKAGQ